MAARIFDRGDLERPFHGAEIRDHHLKGGHLAIKEQLARARIAGRIAENPRTADRRRFHTRAAQQFAPAPRAFQTGDIDALRVETHPRGAQPRDGLETPVARQVDLDQQVLAILYRHVSFSDCSKGYSVSSTRARKLRSIRRSAPLPSRAARARMNLRLTSRPRASVRPSAAASASLTAPATSLAP